MRCRLRGGGNRFRVVRARHQGTRGLSQTGTRSLSQLASFRRICRSPNTSSLVFRKVPLVWGLEPRIHTNGLECFHGFSRSLSSCGGLISGTNPPLSCTIFRSFKSICVHSVESRGGAPALDRGSRCCRRLSPLAGASISFLAAFPRPRSSNRTCGFPASGFQSRSCLRPRMALWLRPQASESIGFP